jgi:hypothetical protein
MLRFLLLAAAIPTAPAPVAPGTDLTVLPLAFPGYELRMLEQRKTLTYEVNGSKVEVHLPIFFYLPDLAQAQATRALQQAVDELRRAVHEPDRNEYDFAALLNRFESALAALAPHS